MVRQNVRWTVARLPAVGANHIYTVCSGTRRFRLPTPFELINTLRSGAKSRRQLAGTMNP